MKATASSILRAGMPREGSRAAYRSRRFNLAAIGINAGLLAVAFIGCSTVTPAHVTPAGHSVAFDGPWQDAGIPDALNPVKAANGQQIGLRVTQFYMDALKSRVAKYGARLTPPLTLANYLAGSHQMPYYSSPVRGLPGQP